MPGNSHARAPKDPLSIIQESTLVGAGLQYRSPEEMRTNVLGRSPATQKN